RPTCTAVALPSSELPVELIEPNGRSRVFRLTPGGPTATLTGGAAHLSPPFHAPAFARGVRPHLIRPGAQHMSIKFDCDCGQRVAARESSAGRWVRCPKCRTKILVPLGVDPDNSHSPTDPVLGGSPQAVLHLHERHGRRQARTRNDRTVTRFEQWLI